MQRETCGKLGPEGCQLTVEPGLAEGIGSEETETPKN